MTTPNPMLLIPICWLDNKHFPSLVVEYEINNGKSRPLNGSWYCSHCHCRLDNIPQVMFKHERSREVQRVPTERLSERQDESSNSL